MSTKDLDKKWTYLCIKMGLHPRAWETMTAREFLEKLKREHELRGIK